jgi:hypothetical protein
MSLIVLLRMECDERDHLERVLRTATHELAWILQEELRLVFERQQDEAFIAVVEKGIAHQRGALATYFKHVAEHGCTQAATSA